MGYNNKTENKLTALHNIDTIVIKKLNKRLGCTRYIHIYAQNKMKIQCLGRQIFYNYNYNTNKFVCDPVAFLGGTMLTDKMAINQQQKHA